MHVWVGESTQFNGRPEAFTKMMRPSRNVKTSYVTVKTTSNQKLSSKTRRTIEDQQEEALEAKRTNHRARERRRLKRTNGIVFDRDALMDKSSDWPERAKTYLRGAERGYRGDGFCANGRPELNARKRTWTVLTRL